MDWEDENIVGVVGEVNPELVKPTVLPEGPNQECCIFITGKHAGFKHLGP